MANFEFKLSPSIILGNYSLARIGEHVGPFGNSFMLITEPDLKESSPVEKISKALEEKGISIFVFDGVDQSPNSETVDRTLSLARGAHVDGIIAFGGMTTCSIARSTASLYYEKRSLYDFVEGVVPETQPLPLIQIPNTCRDPFLFMKTSPIIDSRNKSTKLLKCQNDLHKLVIFDPSTYTGVSQNTLTSMIYAGVNVAFEGYVSTKSNFFSETILKKAIETFLVAVNPKKEKLLASSKEMLLAEAACLTSMGLAGSEPGIGSAISLTCGGRYNISSSLISTILLPYVMSDAIQSNLEKVANIAKMLDVELMEGSDFVEIAQTGILEIRRQLSEANLPTRLKDVDLTIESLVPVAEDTSNLSFMNYIPRPMSSADVFELIKEAF